VLKLAEDAEAKPALRAAAKPLNCETENEALNEVPIPRVVVGCCIEIVDDDGDPFVVVAAAAAAGTAFGHGDGDC